MSSLRTTIVSRVVTLLGLVSLCATATSFFFVSVEINSFLDAQLQEMAINLGPANRSGGSPLAATEKEDHLNVRIWDHAGQLIHRSGAAAVIPWQPPLGFSDYRRDGKAWRVYRWSDARQNIQIAQTWDARWEIAMKAAAGAALPLALAIPLALLILKRSIDRTLRGLQRLSGDISRRSIDAKEPLRPTGVPDEIVPLIEAIDQHVERHRQALEAQRRFVADAAHELRTPLAALEIQTANLAAIGSPDMLNELEAGVRRASRLADQLLAMARVEGAAQRVWKEIDLVALTTSILPEFLPLADRKDIEIGMDADRPVSVRNDPNAVSQLIRILMDNAVRYSGNGAIDVRIDCIGKAATVEIIDGGPGIARDALPLIYERFFRAAPQEIEGTGLGLAIAKATATRNGISLSHANRKDARGTIAKLEFTNADIA